MISIILAIDENNLIGSKMSKYGLPWHYPEDLKFYQTKTTGKVCLMGRKTNDAIGKILPNRETVILTHQKGLEVAGATIINDLGIYLEKYKNTPEELMVVGGAEIIKEVWSQADVIYLTRIHQTHQGDTYLNDLDFTNLKLVDSYRGTNKILEFQTWEPK